MENMEIAGVLKELGDLLEIQGSNPFRVRAYRNAVRTINDLTRPLTGMVEAGEDLTELPGIGKEMAAHIRELVEWGELSALEALGEEVPRTLTDLIRLDGVGPKKAKRLWEELGVTSVDELEGALKEDRVAGLSGFGRKSADKISSSIQDFRKHQGRFLLSEADVLVQPLFRYLKEIPQVEKLEAAGSYRRRRETVGDIDVLVLCREGQEGVMEAFQEYPGVVRVEGAGETKGRVLLRSGLPVDLRIIPPESYGAALHYFTGSKEHNVSIRTLGVKKGLKINEYGVFPGSEDGRSEEGAAADAPSVEGESMRSDEERLGGDEEADVFRWVGLPWISPLLRENRGEIEAAGRSDLPEALTLTDIRGDLQMHSTWSDGANTLWEMAEACRTRGYEYFSITDHSQAVTVAGGLKPPQVREQWDEVEEVRQSVDRIHLFRSLEVDILAHPTGRILNRREPFALDVEAVLQAAASLDVAVELNAHPSRLDLHDRHLRRAKELGVKVAVSTDAHSVQDLELMSYGVDQANRGWLEKGDVLNTMALKDFEAWRNRKRTRAGKA